MGSPSSEPERQESEGPQHRVRIEKPFGISKYAVTFEEYDAFVKATQRDKPDDEGWGRGRRPAINVSWEDAAAYIKWLCEQTGKHYRLPSEAEWEYAARAGTKTPFHTGEQISTAQANFNGNHTYNGSAQGEHRGKTLEVGSFPANTFGLHDVHGNVWEWVHDCWHENYEGAPEDGAAWQSGDCTWRVLRGGSWGLEPGGLRSAYRNGDRPTDRSSNWGFRLARTL
ncbi:MAG: formylglycine-generating enzyme family protein [Rhodobacteraceae bacterium]|nr:formylglycine-generating enzyme family protein [Paracoccaceae bacterium]